MNQGAGGSGSGGPGGRGGPRPHGGRPNTRANILDRPRTVVFDCREFSVLPPVEELAPFIYERVLVEQENKKYFQQIDNLFPDEDGRKYLLQMKNEESTGKMAELLAPGITWPGYRNEEKGRDVIIHGFCMQNPVLDITISGVGYWNDERVVRGVVEQWGEIKEMSRKTYTQYGHTFGTDKWLLKLVKKKEIVIPPVVFHLGSERSSEEMVKWKVFYRGMAKVCYRCLKEGHLGRECQDNPVNIEQLATQAEYEKAPAAPNESDVISGERRTFAQIVKDDSFVQTRLAREKAVQQRRDEAAAAAREEKEARERRKKERGKKVSEAGIKDAEKESDNDEDLLYDEAVTGGQTIDWSVVGLSDKVDKRLAGSPGLSQPETKAARVDQGDLRRSSGTH